MSKNHHCLTSRSSANNAARAVSNWEELGSVSWYQHLCSTSGQFSDNCYQVSARINSFWISLIRSVAAISPETYLGALEMIPTAPTTSTAHYYCIWEAQVDHWQSPSCPHPTRIAAEREAVAKTSLQSLLEVIVVIVKVNAWPRCKRALLIASKH